MYGYQEYIDLSPEQILQKVSQQKIFEFILNSTFSFEDRYCSPFREDTNPGCRFEERDDGTILFIDFGDIPTHRNCFMMVMERYSVAMYGAISIICSKFNLSTSKIDYKEAPALNVYNPKSKSTDKTELSFNIIDPSKKDKLYWSQFVISIENLKEDNVYCSNRITISNSKGKRSFNVYGNCYVFDFLHSCKVYQPYSEKYKYITNCDENDIGNIDNLPETGDVLIIQKSYKDHRVIRNTLIDSNVIWFQNEGCIPSIDILTNLSSRFKLIKVFFDSDEAGIIAAIKITAILNKIRPFSAETICIPGRFQYKDPSTFIHKEGRKDLVKILKEIGL